MLVQNKDDIMNKDVADTGCVDSLLLPEGTDFLITRIGGGYSDELNVTYRWPRQFGETTVLLVATNTIKARALNKFRVEEIDGQFFVINDVKVNYEEQTKFCVESREVGMAIIKAVVETFACKELTQSQLPIQPQYYRYNQIAKEFNSLIFTGLSIVLTFSASVWFLFR